MQRPSQTPRDQHFPAQPPPAYPVLGQEKRASSSKQGQTWIQRHPLLASFLVFVVIVIGVAFGLQQIVIVHNASAKPMQRQPEGASVQVPSIKAHISTPRPKKAHSWTVVETFQGKGTGKTIMFHAPSDWRLVWSCNPTSFYAGAYNLLINIESANATWLGIAAINTLCKKGNTGGIFEEHQGGDAYFDITSEGDWIIQVQEMR